MAILHFSRVDLQREVGSRLAADMIAAVSAFFHLPLLQGGACEGALGDICLIHSRTSLCRDDHVAVKVVKHKAPVALFLQGEELGCDVASLIYMYVGLVRAAPAVYVEAVVPVCDAADHVRLAVRGGCRVVGSGGIGRSRGGRGGGSDEGVGEGFIGEA